jgi:mRNA interferase RelE/StbE
MPGNKDYKIEIEEKVIKEDLPKLDSKTKEIIRRKILKLKENPYLGKPLRGNLFGCYKIKVSKYRVIYKIKNQELIIIIIAVGKRENSLIYFLAEKRLK